MRPCKNCQNSIENKVNIFCSQSCAAKFNNKRKESKPKICCLCNNSFSKTRDNRENKYCFDCIKNRRYVKRSEVLEECKTDRSRKGILLRLFGHQCQICKNTEWLGSPIPIDIDHISGNSSDNSKENLRLVCPNCHAQTPTYKAKNKGSGREYRRKRFTGTPQ